MPGLINSRRTQGTTDPPQTPKAYSFTVPEVTIIGNNGENAADPSSAARIPSCQYRSQILPVPALPQPLLYFGPPCRKPKGPEVEEDLVRMFMQRTREIRDRKKDSKQKNNIGTGDRRNFSIYSSMGRPTPSEVQELTGWCNALSSNPSATSNIWVPQRPTCMQKRQSGFVGPIMSNAILDQKGLGRQIEEQCEGQRRLGTKHRAPPEESRGEAGSRDTAIWWSAAPPDAPVTAADIHRSAGHIFPEDRRFQRRGLSSTLPPSDIRILSKLEAVFDNQGLYKQLISCPKVDAQMIIDVFQMLLDTLVLADDLRKNLITAMRRLSKRTELYSSSFNLQDPVQILEDYPSDSGGYADIHKAQLRGEHLCLKVVRTYKNPLLKQIAKVYGREAIVWAQLSHPNILPFYGLYAFQSRIAFVSPWMENGYLVDHLARNSDANRVLLCSDVAAGLTYLHKHSVVHGDLKAANVLVDGSGRACLADFGLATVTDPQISHWASGFPATSKIRWQAPELIVPNSDSTQQVRNSKASDVFAWACLCYEAITGLLPFHECARESTVMLRISRGDHPTKPVDGAGQGLTKRMWNIMEDCWKFHPKDRPHMSGVMSQLALEVPLDTRPPSRWQARSAVKFRNVQRATSDYYQPTLEDLDVILT